MELARVDKPIGTMLLLWPCVWSISMASYSLGTPLTTSLGMIGLFSTGAFVMRGAGCTINDLWDRDFDNRVERTKMRPLASGAITPKQAFGFLFLQLSAGLAVLTQLNWYSIALGASSLSVVIIYPFMKRVTYWPQFTLGLAFNWGALLGWSAIAGSSNWAVTLPMYAAGICWTLVYDTIYAHQDKADDKLVGIKSTALYMAEKTKLWLTGFSASTIALLNVSGFMNGQGLAFYLITTILGGGHLAWQLKNVNLNDPKSCWKMFKSNTWFGAIITLAICADAAWAYCLN